MAVAPSGSPPAGAADVLAAAGGDQKPPAGGDQKPPAGNEVPAVAPWAGTDGPWTIGDKPWYATIPEDDVRELMGNKAYANPAVLAASYAGLLKLQNGNPNVVDMPGEGASEEQMNTFYAKKGRPDTPEGYTITAPEGFTPNPDMVEFGRKLFHNVGLNGAEAQRAMTAWEGFAAEQNKKITDEWTAENTKGVDALKAKLGDNFDAFIAAGNRVVQGAKLSNEIIAKVEAHTGTADILELLGAIGQASAEGKLIGTGSEGGTGDPSPGAMNAEQAQAAIDALRNDPEFVKVYEDKTADGHEDAVAKMVALFARL